MSERYAVCPYCKGSGVKQRKDLILHKIVKDDCFLCDGSGFDGSVDAWLEADRQKDPEEWLLDHGCNDFITDYGY